MKRYTGCSTIVSAPAWTVQSSLQSSTERRRSVSLVTVRTQWSGAVLAVNRSLLSTPAPRRSG